MKNVFFVLMCVALVLATSCASTGTKKKVNSEDDIKKNQQLLNEFREVAKKPIYVEKCGNSLDPLCDSCNNIYDQVAKQNVEVFEKLRGNEISEELARAFWDGSNEEEIIQKANNRIAGMADSDKEKYTAEAMVATAKEQFCFESYTAYKQELKEALDDAARNEITTKAQADVEYWARLEAGKTVFERRFDKETCDKYVSTFDALVISIQEASKGIVSAGQDLIKKLGADAKTKISEEKARLQAEGVSGLELLKAVKGVSASITEQTKKETENIKDLLNVAQKQASFELKTIAWCKEQTEIMKSYNE
ncbi:MAG: hypothetical protein MJ202_06520 [Lentisphaeria bacterium]|nr:hypothetical protein [Lentisphaeria bacterium]